MQIAIIGQGYVGTALGVAAHKVGHQVIGIDTDERRVKSIKNLGYFVSSDYEHIKSAEIVILAVPTPLKSNLEPDLSYLESACQSIKGKIKSGTLIVNESTSFPGTLRSIIREILGDNFMYATAPERVDPANEKWNMFNTPRLVGGLTNDAKTKAIAFYRTICPEIIGVSTAEVAEAAKLFENTFRQVNIALVNEFAQITNALGIPTFETLDVANTKPYGFMKFSPSVGVGGHCIPVDPHYLSFAANNFGVNASFIELANKINREMPHYIANRIDELFHLPEKSVQVVGISYKANVDDTRESPAFELISVLRSKGYKVNWHDPIVSRFRDEISRPLEAVNLGIICTLHDSIDLSPWEIMNINVIDVSTSTNSKWTKFL